MTIPENKPARQEIVKNIFNPVDPCKDDSVTELKDYGLKFYQPARGYRFSVDALLLSEFAMPGRNDRVIDLGAGCGVISMVMAKRFKEISILAVEVQDTLAMFCRKNIDLNKLHNRMKLLHSDLKEINSFCTAGSVDYVVSNPPYRSPLAGRISLDSQEALARHEILMTLDDLLVAAAYLLKTGGRFSVIYPAERFVALASSMRKVGIEPKRAQFIHPHKRSGARLCLVEGRRCGGEELTVLPPVFLNES